MKSFSLLLVLFTKLNLCCVFNRESLKINFRYFIITNGIELTIIDTHAHRMVGG